MDIEGETVKKVYWEKLSLAILNSTLKINNTVYVFQEDSSLKCITCESTCSTHSSFYLTTYIVFTSAFSWKRFKKDKFLKASHTLISISDFRTLIVSSFLLPSELVRWKLHKVPRTQALGLFLFTMNRGLSTFHTAIINIYLDQRCQTCSLWVRSGPQRASIRPTSHSLCSSFSQAVALSHLQAPLWHVSPWFLQCKCWLQPLGAQGESEQSKELYNLSSYLPFPETEADFLHRLMIARDRMESRQ